MELSKNYTPAATEEKWYKHWLEKEYFSSVPDDREPFTVVIPPPNVTGVLHMGHTLNATVQDILVRKARMSGFNACWVPGSDHASIATEAKVVGMLKEKGIEKNQLSRSEFLKYAFEWKEKYGGIIYSQIAKLGCSVDWKRVTFTMDSHYYKAVIKVFIDLYNKGLIYRGARMINWDPAAKTALSDEEVEYKDLEGKLYYLKYRIVDGGQWTVDSAMGADSGQRTADSKKETGSAPSTVNGQRSTVNDSGVNDYILIATQRPETIMGDTAICVNPNDERYAHLKGKQAIVPLINRPVPIIFDEYVDPAFGTGALKVTPAHDINDYNLGLKHNLQVIDTLNEDGTLSEAAQIFVGEDRFTARKNIIAALKENQLLEKEESYQTRLGYSQRSGAVVEPRISTQWFLKMKEMTAPALNVVLEEDIKIHPGEKFLATYKYWLENVKDWCISRQLWWGQQIPAWYAPDGSLQVAETREQAYEMFIREWAKTPAATAKGVIHNTPFLIEQLTQDEDVLDTWFSSWLWPMEVFNGISEPANKELNYYYPTSVLVTGQDIIFFWVARMVMAGMEYEKKIPFRDVYFTGMVRDKLGRKMSKSLGNSPDLLELIEKYGADAVRFGIMISSPAGNDLLFDESSLEQGRNFNNKIWNALKLVKMWSARTSSSDVANEDFAVKWFAERLNQVSAEVDNLMKQFRLSEALKTIYSLIWDDFCSWYLEWIKPGFEQPISEKVYHQTIEYFTALMQLLHPFMPFITEEIYHLLQERSDDLCIRQFSKPLPVKNEMLQQGDLLKEVITQLRDSRNKHQLKPKDQVTLHIQTTSESTYRLIEPLLRKQVNAGSVAYTQEPVKNSITVVSGKDKFYMETAQEVNTGSQKEDLLKELNYLKGFILSVEKKLGNERFVQNAKPEVVALERKKKADAEMKLKVIEESLGVLG
jgi:valyl-tRNA synthetase